MTRDEAEDLFSEAWEGTLSEVQQQTFDNVLEQDLELRTKYERFCALFQDVGAAASAPDGVDKGPEPPRDVLPAVQETLFRRSRGRYYRDRFSRGAGKELWMATSAAGLILLLVAAIWFAMHSVEVELPSPDGSPESPEAPR